MYPNVEPPRDFVGREIKIGDYVVYGMYSRNGAMNGGTVTKLTVKGDRERSFINEKTGNYEYKTLPNWKVQIQVLDHHYDYNTRQYVAGFKLQTLDTPERFAVVELPSE